MIWRNDLLWLAAALWVFVAACKAGVKGSPVTVQMPAVACSSALKADIEGGDADDPCAIPEEAAGTLPGPGPTPEPGATPSPAPSPLPQPSPTAPAPGAAPTPTSPSPAPMGPAPTPAPMPVSGTVTYNFTTPADFTFDNTKLELVSGTARTVALGRTDEHPATASPSLVAWPLPDNAASGGWIDMTDNVLLFHFDETALDTLPASADFADTSGSGIHANGAPAVPGINGRLGKMAGFDNGNAPLTIAAAGLTGATPTTETFLFWIKLTMPPSANYGILESSSSQNSGSPERLIAIHGASGGVRACVCGCPVYTTPTTTPLAVHQWRHVAWVRNGTQNKLFIDGRLEIDETLAGTCALDMIRFPSGFPNVIADRAYTDELAVFKRALAPSEIAEIYRRQSQKYTARYESRVFDAQIVAPVAQLAFTPDRPYGKPLPSNGATTARVETGYAVGDNVAMADNILLMRFDESSWNGTAGEVIDSSGNNLHGQALGAVARKGKIGNAAILDGVDDYILLPDSPLLEVTTNATISAWINLSEFPASGSQGIFQCGSSTDRWYLYLDSRKPALGSEISGSFSFSVQTAATMTDFGHPWHHVAAVLDTSQGVTQDRIALYIDGVRIANADKSTTWNNATFSCDGAGSVVGRVFAGGWHYGKGGIDELAIWKRSMTDAEIAALYRRGAARLGFQVRTCNAANCAGTPYVGPDGTEHTTYSEFSNALLTPPTVMTLAGLTDRRYFQYRALFGTEDAGVTPLLSSIRPLPVLYETTSPTIVPATAATTFDALTGFTATASAGVRFQLSNDGGTSWLYHDGAAWVAATAGLTHANTAAAVDAAAGDFPVGGGQLLVRAFLASSGADVRAELTEIEIGYTH